MLMIRKTIISILLVSLLFSNLSDCQVGRWLQSDENCMEMRLRRVLGQLLTLNSDRGQMSRAATDREIDKLSAMIKWTLFGQSPKLGTRRSDLMSWWNPGAWFGENPGVLLGGSAGIGVIAGPKGIWAGMGGGFGPVTVKSTWKNKTSSNQLVAGQIPGIGLSENAENDPVGFTEPPDSILWTYTWTPTPGGNTAGWNIGTPKTDATNRYDWFPKPSETPNPFGPTNDWFPKPTETPNPFGPTNLVNWKFPPTTRPNWSFPPANKPNWSFPPPNKPNWAFPPTNKPKWDFGSTNRPRWDLGLKHRPAWPHNSTIKGNWFLSTTAKPNWFPTPKVNEPTTQPTTKDGWNEFTKEIPPWRTSTDASPQTMSSSTLAE